MTLSDLTAYAEDKYRIQEEYKWPDFPGFSVLTDPLTGRWTALLMRQWDSDSGTEIQRCDIKCGPLSPAAASPAFLHPPFRMRGVKWVGIQMDDDTDSQTVLRLFDRAMAGDPTGCTIVLESPHAPAFPEYRETPLPLAGRSSSSPAETIPKKIRQMRTLCICSSGSFAEKCRNFYHQAKFMEDYEDDVPWTGAVSCFFPTYHDLSTRQLRGYFSWRTHVRKGDYQPVSPSLAYLYLYELLNGIGVSSPVDTLKSMKAFEARFVDAGFGDHAMRQNIRRWMLEFAVVKNLPVQTVLELAEPEMLKRDRALAVLRHPASYTDGEVFQALCDAGGKKLCASPVIKKQADRGRRLFGRIWKHAADQSERAGGDLFNDCFGRLSVFPWHPLANTVYFQRGQTEDRRYELNECRRYLCRSGKWHVEAYDKLTFGRTLFAGFLHESDLKLRRYLKTGSYLTEKPGGAWAASFADAVITADQREEREAARPEIILDLSGLDQIRRDASVVMDSLLTEDERSEPDESAPAVEEAPSLQPDETPRPLPPGLPLDSLQVRILRALLDGEDAGSLIRENRLMPSIAADSINEALFEEFGDTVLTCDDDRLSLLEDYREDLEQLLGGKDT